MTQDELKAFRKGISVALECIDVAKEVFEETLDGDGLLEKNMRETISETFIMLKKIIEMKLKEQS